MAGERIAPAGFETTVTNQTLRDNGIAHLKAHDSWDHQVVMTITAGQDSILGSWEQGFMRSSKAGGPQALGLWEGHGTLVMRRPARDCPSR